MRVRPCFVEGGQVIFLSEQHKAAVEWTEAGFPVFPCISNAQGLGGPYGEAKRPACAGGFLVATTDRSQIDAWWTENPAYNPATPPGKSGYTVVDLDPGGVPESELPDTFESRTPRGGRHLWYRGTLPSNTASKISPHVDTRSLTGYVLLPGSCVHNKAYELVSDRDIVALPQWVIDRATASHTRVRASDVALDLPGNVARASTLLRDYARGGDVAISGRGGNNKTFAVAAELFNLGLTEHTVWTLLKDEFNPHCQPPWSDDELGTLVRNAACYAQNEQGAWAVAPAAEVFGASLDKLHLTSQPEPRSRFYFKDEDEQDTALDPEWLIESVLPDRSIVLMLGQKGTFKSFLGGDLALAAASGAESFGFKPKRTGPTFYGAHEGRSAIEKPRRHAWKIARQVEGKIPFYVAPAPRVINPDECEAFREAIRVRLREPGQKKITLIVLDTVAKCMAGLSENDPKDAQVFIDFCESLRDEFECVVLAQHHMGKDVTRGSRGHSALPGGFETIMTVTRIPGAKFVSVKIDYHKDAEEPEAPFQFEGKSIANSLVFQLVEKAAFQEAEQANDPITPTKVGAALRALNALSWETSVTSKVVATEILRSAIQDDPEKHNADAEELARRLASRSVSRLRLYCEKRGRDLRWFRPPSEAQA